MILRPGPRPDPAPSHPDGRPLWRFSYYDWKDRDPHEALTDDPAIVEWLAGMRHGTVARAIGDDVPGRPGIPLVTRFVAAPIRAASVSPGPDLAGFEPPAPEGPLAEWATALRGYLEAQAWPDFLDRISEEPLPPPGESIAIGMCAVTTALALRLLREADPDGGWIAEGGHPTILYPDMKGQFRAAYAGLDGGMWDRLRDRWDGHYWIRGTHDGEPVIVDLTGDQYGWSPVIVTRADDPRYRASYRPAQANKDTTFPETRGKFGAWIQLHAQRIEATLDLPSPVPAGMRP